MLENDWRPEDIKNTKFNFYLAHGSACNLKSDYIFPFPAILFQYQNIQILSSISLDLSSSKLAESIPNREKYNFFIVSSREFVIAWVKSQDFVCLE